MSLAIETEISYPAEESQAFYPALTAELGALLHSERDWLVNLANAAALLRQRLGSVNWVGFYLFRNNELVLGPFQGKPACTRIKIGRGVCGTAAEKRASVLVADVSKFPGHITCDPLSGSELVVPIVVGGRLVGVLDLDSPKLSRFSDSDRAGLEDFVTKLILGTDWPLPRESRT